jgi:PAS domain S-box-containing protein
LGTLIKILLVEDVEDDALLLIRAVQKGGYETEYLRVDTAEKLIAALKTESWDIVISDYSLPGFSGMTALDILKNQERYTPAIMVSGIMGEEIAVEAMQAGANDYIIKGNYARLVPAIERELSDAIVRRERRAALEALRQSENRYRAIVEDQTELINRYNLAGEITYVNTTFARFFGKEPTELIGARHADFLDAQIANSLEKILAGLNSENLFNISEHLHITPDGKEHWVQWYDRLILDSDGTPFEYQGVGREITEIKQAEDELRVFASNLERYATQLQVAADIARDAATARDLESLLKRAVDLVHQRFGFYHASVFLIDESQEYAVITAATGKRGAQLLAQEHKLKIGEVGIVGHVAATGQPRISLDVGVDTVHFAQPLLPDTRSEMAVPLKVMDRVIGVFDVQSQQASDFDGNDLIVLQTMADQIAIAIDNIRLVQETQRRSQEIAGLYDAAMTTSSLLDTEHLLQRLYEQVQQLIAPDAFMIAVLHENTDEFSIVVAMEKDEPVVEFLGKAFPISDGGFTGWVFENHQTLLVGDVENDSLPIDPIQGEFPIRSWLGVPLISRERLIGVTSIQSFKPNQFDISHQRFLESLAAQAAIALENSRLFGAERAAREQAETLREVAQVVGSSLEPDEVLNLILAQMRRVLNFDTASVILYEDDERPTFVSVIGYEDDDEVKTQSGVHLEKSTILKKMAEDLQPIMINDVRDHLEWVWVPGADHVRSFMGVPIVKRNVMIGTLMIDSRNTNYFGTDELQTLQDLAQQISIAIENANLFEAERAAREKAEALREAAQVISSKLSLDQVIEAVLEQLARVLAYDSACVIMVGNHLARVIAGRGYEKFTDTPNLSTITFSKDASVVLNVVQRCQALMIPDVNDYPGWVVTPFSEHVRSTLAVPLWVREQVIGFFSIDRVKPGGFSLSDLELAEVFAAQTSAAIENVRLFEAQEKRAVELEKLRQVSLSLTASLEPQAVLDAILDGVYQLVGDVLDAHIFIYHEERLTFGASLWHDGSRGNLYAEPRPNGLTYSVARTGNTIKVDNFQTHPLFSGEEGAKGWHGSIIGMPVKIGERVVGVLNVAHSEPYAFTDVEMNLFRLLGDQAALAIENARLFEQTMTERRHMALLYDVGQAIVAAFESDTILARALELTCQTLGGEAGAAWLYLPDEDQLNIRTLFINGMVAIEDHIPIEDRKMELSDGLVGWAARERLPVNVENIQENPDWKSVPYLEEETHSFLAAPIMEGQNLLGVIAILHSEKAAFTKAHLELIQTNCQQVGLALSNARRYQDINRLVDLLAAEQYRLESLIEMLPVGVLLLDENHRLQVTNPLGREILAILSPTTEDGIVSVLGNTLLTNLLTHQDDQLPVEISVLDPQPGIFEVQARAIGGDQIQWVLSLRDVTQEREIQERVQMQNRLATVGQLAAGIAHDFNNIMAAIVVYADLLMMEPNLSQASQERLTTIQQQVQRASSLIRQILDFSRRSVMEQSALDLLPFMKEMEKLLERTLPETVRLELTYEDGDYQTLADPTRLQQVFMNLAVNARDAMQDGGRLRFELNLFVLSPGDIAPVVDMPLGNWLHVGVVDTGVGISPDSLSRIFEPFYTTKPIGQGTGLGLAQVYGIIRQHEGFIDVKSQVGVGTQFGIYLPALPGQAVGDETDIDRSLIDGSGKTVLLVEDDATTLTALQALLDAHQFQVLAASNGSAALAILEVQHAAISLVISDVVMPEMGGIDLYTIMKIRWPEIKMVFITGHPLDSQDQDVLERGRVVWLQKPFSITDFNRAVRKVFG